MSEINVDTIKDKTGTTAITIDTSGLTTINKLNPTIVPMWWGLKGSDQTLTRGSKTKLTSFNTGEIDTDSAFDQTTFTVPSGKGGVYMLQSHTFFDYSNVGSDGEQGYSYFYINGTERDRMGVAGQNTPDFTQPVLSHVTFVTLSAGDTVEVYAALWDANGGNSRVLGGANFGCQFGGMKVG